MPDYLAVASSCNFTKQNVVVVGGTQGIGAGIALRFAELGASVLIAGRNASLGSQMLESLKSKAPANAKFAFVQKDLGAVEGIKEVAEEIAKWAGDDGVNYLFQTQGTVGHALELYPPSEPPCIGGIAYFMPQSPEDAPIGFNVQVLSHFLIPYILMSRPKPVLGEGAQICNIGRPGTSLGSLDFDDLTGYKAAKAGSFRNTARAWVFMLDVITQEFNTRFPATHTTHLYPGQVVTNGVNAPSLPWFVRYLGRAVVYLLGKSPAEYADIVIYQTASEEGKGLHRAFWDQYSKEVKVDKRISDQELKQKIWEALLKPGEL